MIGVVALVGLAFSLQASVQSAGSPTPVQTPAPRGAATDTGVAATRADAAPTIDGRDDDAVWREAPPITAFKEWRPNEGKAPRFKTEAKVAYDAANLYVIVRNFDPAPDSIKTLLERRDSWTSSDMVWIMVDSYHDRRTGYEFGVNAAGVKIDMAVYDDGNEDQAWDAVWDVATRIDSLGWVAEYRLPLSQMRYSSDKSHIFGFTILRDLSRYSERYSWPLMRQSKPGWVSQFGILEGLEDLESPRRLEAMPYVVTKHATEVIDNRFQNKSRVTMGGDLKYRVAPNVTLDATINPDFGQVEADPSVLNLTAYESFFDERRPFFVAGQGLFRFNVNCSQVNCNGENLYYSRRVGRTPTLAGTYGDTVPLQPTTILGAGKLIGRFPGGLTVAMMDALTKRASSPGDTTFEPMTNFTVIRATQDMRKGNSGVGAMLTAVNRRMDQWSSPYMTSSAYAGALDFRHKFFKNNYEVTGSLDYSRVRADPQAMLSLQQSAVHYYQRPDADLPLDSNRTLLTGDAEELSIGKVGGRHFMFNSAYSRRSPGFEINDMGYLQRADQQSWSTWAGFFDRQERYFYKRFQWNWNWWQYWTTRSLPLEAAVNTNLHINLKNNWGWHMGGTMGQLGTVYDDRAARGGPAIRQDRYLAPWFFINGDDRRAIVPNFNVNLYRADGGRSRNLSLGPGIDLKLMGRFSSSLSVNYSHNIRDNQWYGLYTDTLDVERYTFARLDQRTTSATMRLNYTFTPSVSLQAYAQPFVSKGTYSNLRALSSTPRAKRYEDRYTMFADSSLTNDPGGFNFKALQSNVVFRWEYAPGSTLFAVWNHGRQGNDSVEGTNSFKGDVQDLFSLHPANTFLIKMSYWLNR
jgi:Domain of unknown function (DUF5916)/Carbohydrate family 9 binding domain-like